MNFDFSDDQLAIQGAVEALCADFGDDYWLEAHPGRGRATPCNTSRINQW